MKDYRKVIIAELKSIDAKHMQLMLSRRGWETEMVNNTTDLLNKIATDRYNLVIVSDNLPDGSIIEVAPKIKKISDQGDTLPVVAVTNFTIELEKQQILRAGVDYCLTKPVYNNSLTEVIGHLIEQEQVTAA